MFTHRTLPTEKHRETFAQKKNTHTHIFFYKLHTQTAQKKLHPKIFARRNFTQNSFYTAETFPHRSLYEHFFLLHRNFCRGVFYTENSPHKRFYAQHFLHTDVCIHKTCLYTENELHTKLVHTAHFYTQPVFTQRGFVFPFWSSTFRVPPLKLYFVRNRPLLLIFYTVIIVHLLFN